MAFFKIISFIFILLFFHELGHIISAKILRISIKRVGFSLKPYPHFFVATEWINQQVKRYIYLFSGTTITIVLFIISYQFDFFDSKILIYAFLFQLVIETNPFYSDFTIAIVTNRACNQKVGINKNHYQKIYQDHAFSFLWYAHFTVWVLIILLLAKLNYETSYFTHFYFAVYFL